MKNHLSLTFALVLLELLSACATAPRSPRHRWGVLDVFATRSPAQSESTAPAAVAVSSDSGVPVSSVKQHRIATRAELRSVALSWPLSRVEVTSNFGQRGRQFHEGIDLRAPLGTPVYAAADGVVIYAGSRLRGYGNLVVIRHGQTGISTVYAHNSRLFVRRGQRVARGQKISLSGATGHVSGPHLHFEVRSGIAAVDPKQFLKHENDPDLTAVRIAQRRRMQYQSRRNLASQ